MACFERPGRRMEEVLLTSFTKSWCCYNDSVHLCLVTDLNLEPFGLL